MVATVNGHPILRSELDKRYEARSARSGRPKQSAEGADALRLGLLDEQLIPEEIIQQRAAKMNLTATPEEVDAKFAEMKAPYTDEQFNSGSAQHHTTVDDIKRDIRRTLTINKLLNKEINSKITVSDADIASYYALHKAEFNNIETMYHLAADPGDHHPIAQPGNLQGSKATSDEEASKKIQALKNRDRLRRRFRRPRHELLRESPDLSSRRRHGLGPGGRAAAETPSSSPPSPS